MIVNPKGASVSRELDVGFLEAMAKKLRCTAIRMISQAGSGHPGGSLSAADLITYLYFHQLRVDPRDPRWPERDRFVLSKGHCCPAWYAALAERGFFSADALWTLRDIGSILQGHPDMEKTPGVDMTSGSLGQGLSVGAGMALAGKLAGRDFRVYVMLGDGELQSGQVWEAALAASHYHLDNLVAIVDNNRVQCDGLTSAIMRVEPIAPRWEAFGWHAVDIDGHSFPQIHDAFRVTAAIDGRPKVIVAATTKGKGVSFMEGDHQWHGQPPTEEQARAALRELEGASA
jgi:transketolase